MKERRTEQRVLERVGRAIEEFSLVVPGDRILVAVSGGKDSFGLLWALMKKQASSPFHFDLVAYHLDQGQPGHNTKPIEDHFQKLGIPYEIGFQNTYKRVLELTEPGKVYCSVCAHFRRAILYKAATRHGCNKVALGHHRDDALCTLLLNLFYAGKLQAMPAKYLADDGNCLVVRPLIEAAEQDLKRLAELMHFPIVPCSFCGSRPDAKRAAMNRLLGELERDHPQLRNVMLGALRNVRPSHLLDLALLERLAP